MAWFTLTVSLLLSLSLLQAFYAVEKSYFETIDGSLAEKAHLSNFLPPHNEVHTVQQAYERDLES